MTRSTTPTSAAVPPGPSQTHVPLDLGGYVDLSEVEKLDISDLDGWKRFVRLRDHYQSPPLIDRATYQALNRRDRNRYDTVRRLGNFNPPKQVTPMTAAITAKVIPVLRANMYRMDPGVRSGIFISADGAMGKSTLMREIAADFEAQVEVLGEVMPRSVTFRDRWVPVAWVTVPPKLSIRSLGEAILNFYGFYPAKRLSDSQVTTQVEQTIRDCGTRLLVLDDITRYKDGEADRAASDWIRNLMETSITIVALGVDVRGSGILADGVRGRDKQLRTQTARRFTVLDIEPFTYDTDEATRDWAAHLAAIEDDLLLLDKTPGMLSDDLAEYLYANTHGVIGLLANWVQLAADSVIGRHPRQGGEHLTQAEFDDMLTNAYDATYKPAQSDRPDQSGQPNGLSRDTPARHANSRAKKASRPAADPESVASHDAPPAPQTQTTDPQPRPTRTGKSTSSKNRHGGRVTVWDQPTRAAQ